MANRLLTYEGGFIAADSGNSAGALVQRDPSTSGINVGPVSASQITKTQADIESPAITGAITGAATLATTAAPVQQLDATAAAFTLTLPPVASSSGLKFTFKKIDSSANVPTIKGSGAELIDGANTYTSLSAQYKYATLWCNGTKWFVIAQG